MKTTILTLIAVLFFTGCATHQGTDGRTYTWIKPIPATPGSYAYGSTGVYVNTVTVNGTGYMMVAPR